MKAYEVQEFGIERLALVDRPEPEAGPGEVLVRFRAVSLNYRDIMVITGTYNPRMKLPAIPLSDGAGEVVSVGAGVSRWKEGDRVMPIFAQRWISGDSTEEKRRSSLGAGAHMDGVLREYGTFDQEGLVSVPEHLSFEEAATLPCAGLTAWHAVVRSGRIRPGETVLTLGTGGVSIFALQFAKLAGARVIATTGSSDKIARLDQLGASEVINYRDREDWDAAVSEITDRRGVDHVVEVGGAGTLDRSLNSVRFGGHIAMIGALSSGGGFDPIKLFMKSIRLQGVFVGSRTMFEEMNRAISVAGLRPVIDRVFGFDEVRDALRYMASGSHFGKVVIRI